MAHVAHHTADQRGFGAAMAAPFIALFNALIRISEANPRYQELRRLSQLSDADLAKRGVRREEIVQKVLGPHYL